MVTLRHFLALLAPAFVLTGCSQQTLDSARHDAQQDAAVVNRETQRAAKNAQPQLSKLHLGARVTSSLQAADIHGIRVDADTNGVSLHGTVDTAAQKARAGRIARETLGPDKTIDNQIKVRP
jgi:osmotically-inducible protein OsmY